MYLCCYLFMDLCIYESIYAYIYVCISTCIYVSVYVCIYVFIYACIHVCRYIINVSRLALSHSPVAVPGVGLTRGNRGDGV